MYSIPLYISSYDESNLAASVTGCNILYYDLLYTKYFYGGLTDIGMTCNCMTSDVIAGTAN